MHLVANVLTVTDTILHKRYLITRDEIEINFVASCDSFHLCCCASHIAALPKFRRNRIGVTDDHAVATRCNFVFVRLLETSYTENVRIIQGVVCC